MAVGYLDEVTAANMRSIPKVRGWAATAEGHAPTLRISIDGVPVQIVRPDRSRPDLKSVYANDVLGFETSINACPGQTISVTDVYGKHLNGSPKKIQPIQESHHFAEMLEKFLGEVASRKGRLLEIGSRARSGNTYRHLFPSDIEYIGIDITEGPNVDVVCDAHTLSRSLGWQFDFAFSVSTFEHLLMPWVAVLELNKVMKLGGLVFVQSHQTWPLHEQPVDGWRGLFNFHTGFELIDAAYREPARIQPVIFNQAPMSLPDHCAFLVCGCLARKVGHAIVKWDADVSKVFDLDYSHGT
jgi:hypothetical protein